MLELQLPTHHEWIQSEATYGKLAIEAFEPGFALTVGIAYRRVLMSAIHGAAPTWVKIETVLHEFSHMPGITEDTLDIIMNLRKLVFAVSVNRPKLLRLKVQGPRTVTARLCDSALRSGAPSLTPCGWISAFRKIWFRLAPCISGVSPQKRNARS